jgi:hypothetical protein
MRLNLLDYDLSAVSGRGTTTVSQFNQGLSRVAESLAIEWVSIHKDSAQLIPVQSRIEQYIALDHYSKVVPKHNSTWRPAVPSEVCLRQTTNSGAYYSTADRSFSQALISIDSMGWTSCKHGQLFTTKHTDADPYILYTSGDLDILWRIQDGGTSSDTLKQNLVDLIQSQGRISPSVEELSEVIAIIDQIIEKRNFDTISKAFEEVDLDNAHPAHMVALLRTTGIYRRKIANWEMFRNDVRERLNRQGINVDKVMRGLI